MWHFHGARNGRIGGRLTRQLSSSQAFTDRNNLVKGRQITEEAPQAWRPDSPTCLVKLAEVGLWPILLPPCQPDPSASRGIPLTGLAPTRFILR